MKLPDKKTLYGIGALLGVAVVVYLMTKKQTATNNVTPMRKPRVKANA